MATSYLLIKKQEILVALLCRTALFEFFCIKLKNWLLYDDLTPINSSTELCTSYRNSLGTPRERGGGALVYKKLQCARLCTRMKEMPTLASLARARLGFCNFIAWFTLAHALVSEANFQPCCQSKRMADTIIVR